MLHIHYKLHVIHVFNLNDQSERVLGILTSTSYINALIKCMLLK